MANLGADFILSTASFPFYLMDYCRKKGINPQTLGIKGFMVGGEPGGSIPDLRKQVEDGFASVVQETMGNGDMMGLMWGECEYKNGMHFLGADTCHAEIIHPDTGEVLDIETGVAGEILILVDAPLPSVKPPLKIKVEQSASATILDDLKTRLQDLLREKLIFSSDITLVPPGTLPKYEYKAKLVEKNF